jgi:hypothetical protein
MAMMMMELSCDVSKKFFQQGVWQGVQPPCPLRLQTARAFIIQPPYPFFSHRQQSIPQPLLSKPASERPSGPRLFKPAPELSSRLPLLKPTSERLLNMPHVRKIQSPQIKRWREKARGKRETFNQFLATNFRNLFDLGKNCNAKCWNIVERKNLYYSFNSNTDSYCPPNWKYPVGLSTITVIQYYL